MQNPFRAVSRVFWVQVLAIAVAIAVSAGCSPFAQEKRQYSSSILEYLFPDDTKPSFDQPPPPLEPPLNIGIAFVPESGQIAFDEKSKMDLIQTLAAEFDQHDFVGSLELIPTSHLKPKGGFTNLDQISALYGINVIVLLDYDQVQHTAEGVSTYLYWTWVGSYTVKGEKNDTNTMIDSAMLDIASRKKILHLHGTSHIKGTSTLVNLSEQLRNDSVEGFKDAGADLLEKFRNELPTLQKKIGERH
jgi:rhombotail lipoprotein